MSLSLVSATGPLLDRILDDTFLIWNEGLSRENYSKWWTAQLRTPWGRAHLDRLALMDGPRLVASLKRYDLTMRLGGRLRRTLGIGAVFTPPAFRGRGAAKELLTRVMERGEAEGYEFAALFSEIDPRFYEQLDFVPVPVNEARLEVDLKRGGAPAVLVRSGDDRDLPSIVEMSATRMRDLRLVLERSEDFIRFGITRRRLLAGLGHPGRREVEFLVAEEGHQAVAYLLASVEYPGPADGTARVRWFIEDAGDRDPAGARLGAMLQVMLARLPAAALPVIHAWWPATLTPPQVSFASCAPVKDVLMIRPLRDRMLPLPPVPATEVGFWRLDCF